MEFEEVTASVHESVEQWRVAEHIAGVITSALKGMKFSTTQRYFIQDVVIQALSRCEED